MESVEVSAKSVEEAIQQALIRLDRSRDEVDVTVLSEGHRGLLGFVRGDARVRVSVRGSQAKPSTRSRKTEPAEPKAAAPEPHKPAETTAAAPKPRKPAEPRAAAPEPHEPAAPVQPAQRPNASAIVAQDTLEELLERMAIDADVIYRGGRGEDDSPILLDVVGDDLAILIGRRGETLSSLQFLVNLMVGKRLDSWVRVVVDVEGYRARREESLRSLATRMAERVRRTGQATALEPMPPNERRIVHMTLQDNPHVTTESSGFGEERRVTVMPRSR